MQTAYFSTLLGLAGLERLALVIALLFWPQVAPEVGEYPPPERTYEVGLHQMTLEYADEEGRAESLDVAVWYPTDEASAPFIYPTGSRSYVAVDAAPSADGPFPLVIFNHGFNASEMQSLYLKEALAAEGYIVASVHFNDNLLLSLTDLFHLSNLPNGGGLDEYIHQVYETYFNTVRVPVAGALLDLMLDLNSNETSLFYSAIDAEAVAMGGHSFGGLTTVGLIGGNSDETYNDPRIKAALLLSSPSYPFEKNYGNVHIPIMSMRGELDILLNRPEDNFWYLNDGVNPPYFDLVLRNADHFTFSETDGGKGWVPAAIAEDKRLAVIIDYSLAFFDYYLKDNSEAVTTLNQTAPVLISYFFELEP
ncbi:Platelet-activating factor acetylhydrolase plasma/intracellular isoform II [Dehalogenimonas lykanthroporepellens BL-DC-9]|nr:Platelet-activating factor acetylhydrolase plasma/intracellular isoform II [Dehalogenimonas lykanthroporepellens BL-DC-9]